MQYSRIVRHKFSGRFWTVLLLVLALAAFFLSACGAPAPKPEPLDLLVLHTNDVLGFTEQAT